VHTPNGDDRSAPQHDDPGRRRLPRRRHGRLLRRAKGGGGGCHRTGQRQRPAALLAPVPIFRDAEAPRSGARPNGRKARPADAHRAYRHTTLVADFRYPCGARRHADERFFDRIRRATGAKKRMVSRRSRCSRHHGRPSHWGVRRRSLERIHICRLSDTHVRRRTARCHEQGHRYCSLGTAVPRAAGISPSAASVAPTTAVATHMHNTTTSSLPPLRKVVTKSTSAEFDRATDERAHRLHYRSRRRPANRLVASRAPAYAPYCHSPV
jgi:hypothetical protein